MQVNAVLAGQDGALAHQLAGHAERRAGRQHDLEHRARLRVVISFDQPLAVGQDVVFAVDHAVGRQPALALAQAHRAARGVQAQAYLPGRLNFIIQARAIGKQVQVIGGGGAARQRQLCQGRLGGDKDIFRGHARPDGIERLQPVEQVGILGRGHGPGQGLVKVMVGVDQPGQDDMVRQVEDWSSALAGSWSAGPTCSIKPSRANRPPPEISRRWSSIVTRSAALRMRSVDILTGQCWSSGGSGAEPCSPHP